MLPLYRSEITLWYDCTKFAQSTNHRKFVVEELKITRKIDAKRCQSKLCIQIYTNAHTNLYKYELFVPFSAVPPSYRVHSFSEKQRAPLVRAMQRALPKIFTEV